jgi:hypothetical protein
LARENTKDEVERINRPRFGDPIRDFGKRSINLSKSRPVHFCPIPSTLARLPLSLLPRRFINRSSCPPLHLSIACVIRCPSIITLLFPLRLACHSQLISLQSPSIPDHSVRYAIASRR